MKPSSTFYLPFGRGALPWEKQPDPSINSHSAYASGLRNIPKLHRAEKGWRLTSLKLTGSFLPPKIPRGWKMIWGGSHYFHWFLAVSFREDMSH